MYLLLCKRSRNGSCEALVACSIFRPWKISSGSVSYLSHASQLSDFTVRRYNHENKSRAIQLLSLESKDHQRSSLIFERFFVLEMPAFLCRSSFIRLVFFMCSPWLRVYRMHLAPMYSLDGNGTATMGPALEDPWNLEGN